MTISRIGQKRIIQNCTEYSIAVHWIVDRFGNYFCEYGDSEVEYDKKTKKYKCVKCKAPQGV